MSTAAALSPAGVARRRSSWAVLVGSILVLALALLLVLSGLLVRLGNDHQGHPILPPAVGAGSSASGEVTLSNQGLLPLQYSLEPRASDDPNSAAELPADLSVSVQRVSDGAYLYQGTIRRSMGPLETLLPGQASLLKVTVTSTDSHATAVVPINFTYFWAAGPALPWWWWIPTALLIAAIVAAGYRRRQRSRRT